MLSKFEQRVCIAMLPFGNWQFEKRIQKFSSNQTMVGCDEFTLNSIQVAAKITFVVCLHISETMPFVYKECVKPCFTAIPKGIQQLDIGLLLLHCSVEQVFLKP